MTALRASASARLNWVSGKRRHFLTVLGVVLALMATVNLLDHFGPARSSIVLGPVATVALVVLSRRCGLTWHDLGLSRPTWARGAKIAVGAVVAVLVVYAVGVALPLTRTAFLDARYQLPIGRALFTALVAIPLGTVIVEEIAFRGVLMGLLTRRRGAGWGTAVSSVLFGAWHVLPSLGLVRVNAAVGQVAGSNPLAQVGVVLAVVAFTAVSGVLLGELRRRSGSLLASVGLHWAVNGVGVLVTAVLFATRFAIRALARSGAAPSGRGQVRDRAAG